MRLNKKRHERLLALRSYPQKPTDMKNAYGSASVILRIIQNAWPNPAIINVGGIKFIALKRLRQLPRNN